MKNQKTKNTLSLVFLYLSFLLLFLGCDNSLQITYNHNPVSADNLMPQATQIIQQALADENPRIRANAIEVAAETQQIKLIPKIEKLLKDESAPVRFIAALAIGDLEYSLAEEQVKQLLKDKDENVRISATYALIKLGFHNNLEPLQKAITNNDQTIRANAALLLGKAGDKNALKFLYWALRHRNSDDKVRFNATEAIARLGDERVYPKLWTMLISAYHDDRVFGVGAMGALGTAKAKDALVTMLDDDVLEVRLAAAEQLGSLKETVGELKVLDVFTKNLIAGTDREGAERIKVWTSLAIGQIGTVSLTKFLPQLLKDESKFVRIAAAKAVFQYANRKLTP